MGNRSTVGDYVTLQRGITYKGNLVGKQGPALLGLGSIHPGGGFREGDYKTYGGDCPPKIMLNAGDLFVSLKGATKDGEMIGSIARVPQSVQKGRLTQDTVKLEFRNADLEMSNFLYWVLRTPQYREYCANRATGSAVVALSRDDFLSYPVPILTTFRSHIVQLLEALENKMELNRRVNATLEGMAQAFFKSWFVDFDPVIDNALEAGNPIPEELAERAEVRRQAIVDGTANRKAAKQFPAAFQLSEEMGWIPEGWVVQCLYDLANFINGAAYKESDFTNDPDALPVVKIAEIKNGISGQTKFTHVIKDGKYRINDGEILLSWSGNPDTSIDTFVWTDGEGWLNQHIFKVSLKAEAERFFIFYQLKFLRSTFAEIARDKQTTGLGHFTGADMKRLLIFKPSIEVLTEFNKTAAPFYQRYYQNRLTEKSLTLLRNTLLPKLISGELRIPEAEKIIEEVRV